MTQNGGYGFKEYKLLNITKCYERIYNKPKGL